MAGKHVGRASTYLKAPETYVVLVVEESSLLLALHRANILAYLTFNDHNLKKEC